MNIEDITKKAPVKHNKEVVYSEVLYRILVNKINYITKEKFFELEQKTNEDNINVYCFIF